ncbi:MAG TPA: WG repeat-containing protein [Sphingobacterium sp.]|nr:WG repeat-containing protein [Sphingobacterium sp.]
MKIVFFICFLFFTTNVLTQELVWQEYESIGFSRYSHPLVNIVKNGQQYYYHLDSQLLMDEIETRAIGMTIAMKDGAYGVILDDGDLIIPFEYDGIRIEDDYTGQWYEGIPYNYKFIYLQKNGRYGFADTNGHVLAEPKYEKLKVISKDIIAVTEDNHWGWLDAQTGELLQRCVYEAVEKTYAFDHYVQIQQDGKYGLAKKDGTIVIPIESERSLFFLSLANERYIVAEKQGVHIVYDRQGKVTLQGDYPDLRGIQNSNLFSYQKNKLTGIMDPRSGKVIFEPQFTNIQGAVRGLYVVEKDKKYGIANEQGEMLLPIDYDRIEFVNGEGKIKRDAQIIDMSFYGKSGNPITPEHAARIRFEAKMDSLPYYIRAFKGTRTGIFDWSGNPMVPLSDYEAIAPYYNNDHLYLLVLHAQGETSILDASGKELLPPHYRHPNTYQYSASALDTHLDLKRRYVVLMKDIQADIYPAHIGLFDLKNATMVVAPGPQSITWLNENYFKVIQHGKGDKPDRLMLYNMYGEEVLRFDEDVRDVEILDKQLLLVEKTKGYRDGVYVLMDMSGKVLYENPKWSTRGSFAHIRFPENKEWNRREFHGGWKKMYTDETNLFINEKGEEKRFSEYDQVDAFFGGYALVAKKVTAEADEDNYRFGGAYYHFGIIDSTGKEVFPPIWSSVYTQANDAELLQVKLGDKAGLIDRRGKMRLNPEYEYIESGSNTSYLQIKKDGKFGLITPEGRVVIEPRYDRIRKSTDGKEKTWPLLVQDGEWHYFVGKDGNPYNIRAKEN